LSKLLVFIDLIPPALTEVIIISHKFILLIIIFRHIFQIKPKLAFLFKLNIVFTVVVIIFFALFKF